MINITRAFFPEDTDEIVAIFAEYVRSIEADLSFQDYESEFATLPGKYADPEGCILLARREDELVGCVGYRRVDDHTCELKRLYVRPEARGCMLAVSSSNMPLMPLGRQATLAYVSMCYLSSFRLNGFIVLLGSATLLQ